jgi:hypothetical protein
MSIEKSCAPDYSAQEKKKKGNYLGLFFPYYRFLAVVRLSRNFCDMTSVIFTGKSALRQRQALPDHS